MEYRELGATGLSVSAVSFGAGPVSQTLVGESASAARETVGRAVALGINWFDTAATYGDGRSEDHLGRALAELGVSEHVHVATKVRVMPDELGQIGACASRSVAESLARLRLPRVTLLQVHNSITARPGAQPTSLSPGHVLGSGGLLDAMQKLRADGLVAHLGLTGLGEPAALVEVIASGAFDTLQVPFNLLNPSAGRPAPAGVDQTDYGNLIEVCRRRRMGVFAIRVLAGGALAGRPPSPHTLKTPFFPLDLYRADLRRAERLGGLLPAGLSREETAVRFVLSHPAITSAIVGFGDPAEVDQVVDYAARGPLATELLARLETASLPGSAPPGASARGSET